MIGALVQRLVYMRFVQSCHRGVAAMEADLVYYRRRSAEERAAAVSARNSKVRAVHRELAKHYGERLAALEAEHRRSEIHLVTAA